MLRTTSTAPVIVTDELPYTRASASTLRDMFVVRSVKRGMKLMRRLRKSGWRGRVLMTRGKSTAG